MVYIAKLPRTSYLPDGGDSYWTGKSLQKVVELVYISSQLHLPERAVFIQALKDVLGNWLDASSGVPYFWYDANVGSLIPNPTGYGADTDLNDHHFHYGYYIRA